MFVYSFLSIVLLLITPFALSTIPLVFGVPVGNLQSVVSKDMRNLEREKLDALVEEILCRLSCFVFVQLIEHCSCSPVYRHEQVPFLSVEFRKIGNIYV